MELFVYMLGTVIQGWSERETAIRGWGERIRSKEGLGEVGSATRAWWRMGFFNSRRAGWG